MLFWVAVSQEILTCVTCTCTHLALTFISCQLSPHTHGESFITLYDANTRSAPRSLKLTCVTLQLIGWRSYMWVRVCVWTCIWTQIEPAHATWVLSLLQTVRSASPSFLPHSSFLLRRENLNLDAEQTQICLQSLTQHKHSTLSPSGAKTKLTLYLSSLFILFQQNFYVFFLNVLKEAHL